ncbi:serine protease [Burkholderia sp. Ac-20344]|uniref:serine protease n=1 Tax=Burkholderia sp. Ac-20344 TaxID=2703890 RepID=UPI00197B195C|nr:serine protease [Burkholderia sp. Ac-20344]MBN3830470.1 serine protease [Burkholderia sp. Ac-20344]
MIGAVEYRLDETEHRLSRERIDRGRLPCNVAREAPRAVNPVRAADFGSDNRAWVRPHPLRRRWKMTLLATAMFGVACVVATHLFDERQHRATPGSVYAAAISIAPEAIIAAPVAAVSAMVDAAAADTSFESNAKPAASPGAASAASVPAGAQDARNGDTTATQPARVASRPAKAARGKSDTVSARSTPASRAGTVARNRSAQGTPPEQHRAARVAEGERARVVSSNPHDTRRPADPATVPAPGAAEAVGMTAAEFTHWLAATRDTARPAAPLPKTDAGGADLTVDLPTHTRLVGY